MHTASGLGWRKLAKASHSRCVCSSHLNRRSVSIQPSQAHVLPLLNKDFGIVVGLLASSDLRRQALLEHRAHNREFAFYKA